MQERRKQLVLGAVIISLLGSIVLTYLYSSHRLSFVADSYVSPAKMYVIDDSGEEVFILETTGEGKISDSIRLDKKRDGRFIVLDYLNVDGDQVYVYQIERDILSNHILSENVYRCNFSRGKLELVWELPVKDWEDQNAYSIQVSKGRLTFFTTEMKPESFAYRAVLQTASLAEPVPQRSMAVDYDIGIGFTELFYAANGTVVFVTPEGKIFQGVTAEKQLSPSTEQGEAEGSESEAAPDLPADQSSGEEQTVSPGADGLDGTDQVAGGDEPTVDLTPVGQDEFGVEPVVGAEEQPVEVVLPEPPVREDLPLPVQGEVQVAEVLERSLRGEVLPWQPNLDETGLPLLEARQLLQRKLVNFAGGQNSIYFMDLQKEGIYGLDVRDGQVKALLDGWENLKLRDETRVQPYDLKKLNFREDNIFSATLSTDEESSILAIFENGVGKTFAKFTLPPGSLFLKGLFYFFAFLVAFVFIYILRELFLIFTRGKIPIATKMIAAFIPVVVVALLLLENLMTSMLTQDLIDNQYKELSLVSRQQAGAISTRLLEDINLNRPFDQVYYYELRKILTEVATDSVLVNQQGRSEQEVHNFSYNWLNKVEKGQLVTLYCDQYYINVPIEYYYDQKTTNLYNQAMASGQTMQGEFRDVAGEWMVLAIPVVDEETQQVVAVMETGITKTALEYTVAQNTKQIHRMVLVVMLVLIVLLTAVLMRSLAPLKELRESVQAIINGRLGVQTKVRGRDEVADIGRVFNQMSTSIEYHVNELTGLNEGYYKFVPSKIFQILRKTSVTDVSLGDQMSEDITILTFNAVDFEQIASSLTGEEMFALINKIFSNLVPTVNRNGGVVDKFINAGLVAFYTTGSEAALVTAVSVCQTIDQVNAKGGFGAERRIEMTNGISHGPVMIGIVGHEERLAATTISEHTNLSGFLRKIAPKYGSRILTTAAVMRNIEDFDQKFNARFIGFLHVQANNSTEKLYDVFDGDQEEIRLFKKQTKELFEKGVNLFCAKEFYEARLVFIEVLKRFRQDGAAKEYLYLCDKYYQMGDTGEVRITIEEY